MVDVDLEEQIEYEPIDALPLPQVHQFVKGEWIDYKGRTKVRWGEQQPRRTHLLKLQKIFQVLSVSTVEKYSGQWATYLPLRQ